jgi:hypothetical protein
METQVIQRQRKDIDITKAISDEELYRYLLETKKNGNIFLNKIEQKDFENWLTIKRIRRN